VQHFKIRNDCQAELAKIGVAAKRHYAACFKARKVLESKTQMARTRKIEGDQAMVDLSQFVELARVKDHRLFIIDTVPKKVKEMEKMIKTEDKEKHAARKHMGDEERFREEMQEVSER